MKSPTKLVRPVGHDDSVFIVSVSGGKDSAATVLALREAGIPARYVFADTQWEAPETYEYIATMERILGITIDRVGKPGGMRAAIAGGARFPSRVQRWCTKELKLDELRAYHNRVAEECDTETVNVIGIRAEESEERAKAAEWEYSNEWGGYVWRPILGFTIGDVLDIHHRHGLPVNPLYKRGHSRVGCYPCINATKEEIALVAEHAPDVIDEIERLELGGSAERARRNAETPGRYASEVATYFQKTVAALDEHGTPVLLENGRPKRIGVPFPIREAVAWSKTERGGRETTQLRLFRPNPRGGCFRWGMCEPPAKLSPDGTDADVLAMDAGFDDAADFFRLIAAAPLSSPEALAAFDRWKREDGTKAGLLALGVEA